MKRWTHLATLAILLQAGCVSSPAPPEEPVPGRLPVQIFEADPIATAFTLDIPKGTTSWLVARFVSTADGLVLDAWVGETVVTGHDRPDLPETTSTIASRTVNLTFEPYSNQVLVPGMDVWATHDGPQEYGAAYWVVAAEPTPISHFSLIAGDLNRVAEAEGFRVGTMRFARTGATDLVRWNEAELFDSSPDDVQATARTEPGLLVTSLHAYDPTGSPFRFDVEHDDGSWARWSESAALAATCMAANCLEAFNTTERWVTRDAKTWNLAGTGVPAGTSIFIVALDAFWLSPDAMEGIGRPVVEEMPGGAGIGHFP